MSFLKTIPMTTCQFYGHGLTRRISSRKDKKFGPRDYYLCPDCHLIFLDPAQQLSPEEERARYALHQNHPEDKDYVAFLERLSLPLSRRLVPGPQTGLDYGCGPRPTLSGILAAQGHHVYDYDPFFFPDRRLLERSYDFITLSEVVEHFRQPGEEFKRLKSLLKPGGIIAVMTRMWEDQTDFENWWYQRDPTHVAFYSRRTFEWVAQEYGWTVDFPEENVVIFSSIPKNSFLCVDSSESKEINTQKNCRGTST